MRGKAIEGGAEGDTVSVINLQSKRVVQGTVIGPGQVRRRRAPIAADVTASRQPPARNVRLRANASRAPKPSNVHVAATSHPPRPRRRPAACSARSPAAARRSTASHSIGEQPTLTAIENPTAQPGYKPVQMPMPKPQPASYSPNSLWRNGSRAFFKDQRAAQVGDILTVTVNITDKAAIANETQRSRSNKEDSGINDFSAPRRSAAGCTKVLPGRSSPPTPSASSDGKGSVNRQEALQTNVAAVVTQVLPNGNLVVEGKQEIRVNFEIRELIVAGIVRPEDIQSDNTIDSTKIAQARIAYGGRGQITDVQQPRYGQQVMDVLLPF